MFVSKMKISKSVDNIMKNARAVNKVLPKYDDIYLVIVHDNNKEEEELVVKKSSFLFIHVYLDSSTCP